MTLQSLHPDEVRDLNRGRAYLANVADRHGVTVYSSLEAGLAEVVELVRGRRQQRGGHEREVEGSDGETGGEGAEADGHESGQDAALTGRTCASGSDPSASATPAGVGAGSAAT